MQCNFRFVAGEAFSLCLSGTERVKDVKEMICSKFAGIDREILKLIFRARILSDEEAISDLKATEYETIHVQRRSMRPKVLPDIEEDKDATEFIEPAVEGIMQLGFTKEQVVAALSNADGDVQEAVKALTGVDPSQDRGAGAAVSQNMRQAAREKMVRDISNALRNAPPGLREMLLDSALSDIRASGREFLIDFPLEDLRRSVLAMLNGQNPQLDNLAQTISAPPQVDSRRAAIERLCQTPAGMMLGRDVVIEIFAGSGEDEAKAAAALEACLS